MGRLANKNVKAGLCLTGSLTTLSLGIQKAYTVFCGEMPAAINAHSVPEGLPVGQRNILLLTSLGLLATASRQRMKHLKEVEQIELEQAQLETTITKLANLSEQLAQQLGTISLKYGDETVEPWKPEDTGPLAEVIHLDSRRPQPPSPTPTAPNFTSAA